MLEAENWTVALQVYAGHPNSALALAYQLFELQHSLQRGKRGVPDVIKGLEIALECLYPHTDFDRLGKKLFRRTIKGTAIPEQDDLIRKLTGKK
jgi:hypothetical protein